jgi:hypothetical protein
MGHKPFADIKNQNKNKKKQGMAQCVYNDIRKKQKEQFWRKTTRQQNRQTAARIAYDTAINGA